MAQPASTAAANRVQCLRLKKVAESIMPPWWRAGRWAATRRGVKRSCAESRHLQQQRMQDAGVLGIQRLGQVVAATETAVEGGDGGFSVVQWIAEAGQRIPRVEAFRCRAVGRARPHAEAGLGQLLPREEAARILLARRCQVGVGDHGAAGCSGGW